MSNLLSNLTDFLSSFFGIVNLFFDLIFNRLQIFDVGVGWYMVIFGLLSIFIFGILGGVNND